MTKEEFLTKTESNRKALVDEFGAFVYFLATCVMSLSKVEQFIEAKGFTTKRVPSGTSALEVYTQVRFDGKYVADIRSTGNFTTINFHNHCRKFAEKLVRENWVMAPIKDVHRILDWHDIKKDKMQCLAGGETVLHVEPFLFTVDQVQKFVVDMNLEEVVLETKK